MKIKLKFSGVMQAWGVDEPWTSYRHTNIRPTPNAIYGIIECAMGLAHAGEYKEDDLIRGKLRENTIIEIPNNDGFPDILTDLQTIHGVFDTESASVPCADGTKKKSFPMINKEYIMNGRYEAYVSGDKDTIENIINYLKHPVYPYYLGRACCIPSESVYAGIVEE